jgi:hypothetical protein
MACRMQTCIGLVGHCIAIYRGTIVYSIYRIASRAYVEMQVVEDYFNCKTDRLTKQFVMLMNPQKLTRSANDSDKALTSSLR